MTVRNRPESEVDTFGFGEPKKTKRSISDHRALEPETNTMLPRKHFATRFTFILVLQAAVAPFAWSDDDAPPGRLKLIPRSDANLPSQPAAPAEPTDDEVFRNLDINQDGVLTGTEKRGLEEFDANSDGIVTLDEYRQGMARRRAAADDEREFGWRGGADGVLTGPPLHGVESYDAEQKGSITKEQFLAFRKAVRLRAYGPKKTPADEARMMFWLLDGNRDGRLSGTEMKDYLRYDVNHAERLYEDDFVAAYVKEHGGEKPVDPAKPADEGNTAEWPEVRVPTEGFVFRMPGRVERKVGEELTVYSCEAKLGGINFDFRLQNQGLPEKERDYEPLAPIILPKIVAEIAKQLGGTPRNELKGVDAKGVEDAPCDGHPGLIYRATLTGDKFVSIRLVLRKSRVLQAFVVSQGGKADEQGPLHDRLTARFFASLKPLTGESDDALDGEWIVQSEIENGTPRTENAAKYGLIIKGSKILVVHDNVCDEATSKVDASKSPKHIDIQVPTQDKPLLGIYEIQGDKLKLCTLFRGTKVARPTIFASPAGSSLIFTTFRRKKPDEPSLKDASPSQPETHVQPVKPVEVQPVVPAPPAPTP